MLGLVSGLANGARGKGKIPTIIFSAIVGSVIAGYSYKPAVEFYTEHLPLLSFWVILVIHFGICLAGVLCWKAGAWGNYFASFNGFWDPDRTDVKWIDRIGYKLVPFVGNHAFATNQKRGTICMAIRGAAFSIPLFAYLAVVVHPLAILLALGMAMQGVFYRLAYWVREDYQGGLQVAAAEIATVWFMIDLVSTLTFAG